MSSSVDLVGVPDTTDGQPRSELARFIRAALRPDLLLIVIGVLVLTGWAFDITVFKSIDADLPSMKANAAVGVILAGCALWIDRLDWDSRRRGIGVNLCAVGVLAIGSITVSEYLFGWTIGFDQLLFNETTSAVGTSAPGRMGANAAVVFVLAGLALLFLDSTWRTVRPAQVLAVAVGIIALVALAGYLFEAESLTAFGSATRISIQAGVAYLILSAGLLGARPSVGFMKQATANTPGGDAIRRLIGPAIAIPAALTWLIWRGERAGLYEPLPTLALIVVAVGLSFVGLVWVTARALDRSEALMRARERDTILRLRELDELKNEVMGIVAHDLRSPMTVIAGFAQTLRDQWPEISEADRNNFLDRIQINVNRLSDLVGDVLDVARIESGSFEYDVRPFVVANAVQRTVSEVNTTAPDRTIEVTVTDALPLGVGDENRYWRVITNLLTNALKFSSHDSVVRINVAPHDDYIRVAVTDSGPGFAPSEIPKLFKKFSRLQVAGDGPKPSGTGLGLFICKGIVEGQHGSLTVVSAPGVGSTFAFTIPTRGEVQ